MEKQAIQEIARLALANDVNTIINEKHNNAVLVPEGYKLERLEHLDAAPDLFRGKFSTTILSEFSSYINKHGSDDTGVFINPEKMTANAIIDMGSHVDPEWGKHRASITLKNTPAYQALLEFAGNTLPQQDFIDFAEDWAGNIRFYFGDDFNTGVAFPQVIRTLRRLKVNANTASEQTVSNFSGSRSALESIEITAGQDELPAGFLFEVIPHEGFDRVTFVCQLRAVNSDKDVRLKYRIGQMELTTQLIANEFRDKLTQGIAKEDVSIFIGGMDYQG